MSDRGPSNEHAPPMGGRGERPGRPRRSAGALAVVAVVVVAGCAGAAGQDALGADVGGSMVGAGEGAAVVPGSAAGDGDPGQAIDLLPDEVVPGRGWPGASGTAIVALVPERKELCFEIEVDDLGRPAGAHLHEAPHGQSGEVVLALTAPPGGDGSVEGCVSAPSSRLEAIGREPERYYVDVHSVERPEGAVRGQLRSPCCLGSPP